jgi:glycosyltransferase involved in cell wall biosynthesis
MDQLTIITVWYNESSNLPKLFASLNNYTEGKLNLRKIYIDQSSTDNSVEIAKSYWCEVYVHSNKWFADPDKKRAVETLCDINDRILILDADEELTSSWVNEIVNVMGSDFEVWQIPIRSIIFGWYGGQAYQPRLFKKSWVHLSTEIHKYIEVKSTKVLFLKTPIRNEDLKYRGKEVTTFIEKLNRYADKEIELLWWLSKAQVVWNMFWKPVLWFFWFGIRHKQFLRGVKGLLLCTLMSYYQRTIYAKLYEKKFIN